MLTPYPAGHPLTRAALEPDRARRFEDAGVVAANVIYSSLEKPVAERLAIAEQDLHRSIDLLRGGGIPLDDGLLDLTSLNQNPAQVNAMIAALALAIAGPDRAAFTAGVNQVEPAPGQQKLTVNALHLERSDAGLRLAVEEAPRPPAPADGADAAWRTATLVQVFEEMFADPVFVRQALNATVDAVEAMQRIVAGRLQDFRRLNVLETEREAPYRGLVLRAQVQQELRDHGGTILKLRLPVGADWFDASKAAAYALPSSTLADRLRLLDMDRPSECRSAVNTAVRRAFDRRDPVPELGRFLTLDRYESTVVLRFSITLPEAAVAPPI